MNRRGFIGGLIGLGTGATAAVVIRDSQPKTSSEAKMIRVIVHDDIKYHYDLQQGEQILVRRLVNNQSLLRANR